MQAFDDRMPDFALNRTLHKKECGPMNLRHFLAFSMVALLTSSSSLPARPMVLGVVAEANRAHLGTTTVTAGATVFAGDRYSTETGGMLRLRSGTTMLELAADSLLSVQNLQTGSQTIEAELNRGTLAFSTIRGAALEITACGARVRPSKDGRTAAQISVMGRKELRLRVLRGAVDLSYRGETETIAEGGAYRVILDPAENESEKDKQRPVNDPKKKAFILITLTGVPALIYGLYKGFEYESPERP